MAAFRPVMLMVASVLASVTLTAGLNEAGTIYWAVVPEGQPYPLPNNQSNPLDIAVGHGVARLVVPLEVAEILPDQGLHIVHRPDGDLLYRRS